jgi:hypothetical protein
MKNGWSNKRLAQVLIALAAIVFEVKNHSGKMGASCP